MKIKYGAVVAAALLAAPFAATAQNKTPGFYVGVEGGVNFMQGMNVNVPDALTDEKVGFAVGGVIGYDFVGPRVELEVPYRRNTINSNGDGFTSQVESIAAMVNLIYDIMPENMISPHLGGGVGIARVTQESTRFAFQGIAGLSAVIDDSWRISADYKFFGTSNPNTNGFDYRYLNHTGMLTVAYKFGAPMMAAPPPPRPAAPPVAYMVFFDFDRALVTPTASNTIKQAAAAYKAGGKARVGVTGHADRSGGDAYNMALSLRRATAVKDALVREGVPAANIAVVGRGEAAPLVQTADGVQEPQNRRVEIVLQ